jgi:hypothetical protein
MMANRMYHPHMQVTKVKAPAASWHFPAIPALPLAAWRKAAARRPKAGTRLKKMRKKIKFVRMEQMR